MTDTSLDTPDNSLSLALPWRIALAVVAGLLLTAGYALHPMWWAPWLAPVPLILAASGGRGRARLVGAIAGAVSVTSVLGYYFGQSGAWLGTLIIVILRIVSWNAAARFAETANRRLPAAVAMFALPVVIAAFETATLLISIHGAAGSLAYSQLDLPGVIQVAAIGGVPAIVFIVLLPGSFLGLWLTRRHKPADLAVAGGVLCVAAAACGFYANARLSASQAGPKVHATLIATDRFEFIPKDWTKVWGAYAPQVVRSARAGGVVVLPEKIALLDPVQTAAATHDISAMAQQTRATIVVGLEVHDTAYHNRSLIAGPDGSVAWYTKQRLVPGWEDRDVPGKTPLVVHINGADVGVAICKDMHVPSIGHEYAGTAALMVVLAWDFGQDGWMGARMTALRGVESGYAIARSARDGVLGAYDAEGRIIAEAPSSPGMAVVEADVPAQAQPTPYGRVGDVFGYGCIAAVIALVGLFVARRNQ